MAMQAIKGELTLPATASRVPALHQTITRALRRPGVIISPLPSNVPMPIIGDLQQHQPAAVVLLAGQAAQAAAALPTVARAVQVAVPVDQSAGAQVAQAAVPVDQ